MQSRADGALHVIGAGTLQCPKDMTEQITF